MINKIQDTPKDWTIYDDTGGPILGFIHENDDETYNARQAEPSAHKFVPSIPVGTFSTFQAAQDAIVAANNLHPKTYLP